MLYEDVRGAKEMLSRTSSADVHLPAMEVDAHFTREEFEQLIRPYLERTVVCLERTIVGARLTAKDLVGIFLVGGSSRIPLAAHLIHAQTGVAPTTLEQPETVVVEGAVYAGAAPGALRGNSGVPRPAPVHHPQNRPPLRPGVPQGQRPAQPPQARPVAPVPQVQRPPVQTAQARPPVMPPRPPMIQQPPPRPMVQQQARPVAVPPPPDTGEKRWYQEPAVVLTLIVAVLLVLGFVGLLVVALSK